MALMSLVLLWGISVLFSTSASTPETSSVNSTADPDETNMQAASWHPPPQPAAVPVPTTAEATAPPTVETEKESDMHDSGRSNDSTNALVAANTASSSGPPAAAGEAQTTQQSHNELSSGTAKPAEDQQSAAASAVMKSASSSATTPAATPATIPTTTPAATPAAIPATTPAATPATTPTTTPAATPAAIPAATPATTPTATPATTPTTTPAATPAAIPAKTPATTLASAPATGTVSSPGSLSTTEPEVTTNLPYTISHPDSSVTPVSIQNYTRPSVSMTTTSEAAPASDPAISEKVSSTSETPTISTSSAGILISRVPKRLPIVTTTSALRTTAGTTSSASTEVLPCSTRGLVRNCLIAIASLAALATIFMVTTTILCAKLSARKYKVKKPQQATEMMCISALLPERTHTYTRHRNPVTNGVLVIHSGGDSDEDGGDNLTLSSFLPDNDRYV